MRGVSACNSERRQPGDSGLILKEKKRLTPFIVNGIKNRRLIPMSRY